MIIFRGERRQAFVIPYISRLFEMRTICERNFKNKAYMNKALHKKQRAYDANYPSQPLIYIFCDPPPPNLYQPRASTNNGNREFFPPGIYTGIYSELLLTVAYSRKLQSRALGPRRLYLLALPAAPHILRALCCPVPPAVRPTPCPAKRLQKLTS